MSIDLRADGPHALVAGTTGSGKSEFLRTLIASLALVNRPDELVFLLIDYKGGAAFDACSLLPHTVGLVTDLDDQATQRALVSLGAELRRRERLLRSVGMTDLDSYTTARDKGKAAGGARLPALPRLVIVVDEFATLAEELPDFVSGLVGVAQRGRSLGVHLVLATQRPGGAVTADIRANTAIRVALRVTDVGESMDIVGIVDAARFGRDFPGRAVVRRGEELTHFQTASVTAAHPTTEDALAVTRPFTLLHSAGRGQPLSDATALLAGTDLTAIVSATRAAAERLGIEPIPRPWLPPLPDVIELPESIVLPDGGAAKALAIPYAVLDVPQAQQQRMLCLDLAGHANLLIAGGPRSGRSTALRTLAGSAARRLSISDVHIYGLDGGGGFLGAVAQLSHCGAVVSRSSPQRMVRLIVRLSEELASRQSLLSAAGAQSLAELRAVQASQPSASVLPYLLLLIDDWDGVVRELEPLDSGAATDALFRLAREGSPAGLTVVATGDRSALTGRVSALFSDRVVLRLADRTDFALAGVNPRDVPHHLPAGRGVRVEDGHVLQVGLLPPNATAATPRWDDPRPFVLRALPAVVDPTELPMHDGHPLAVMFGRGGDDAAPIGIDLARHGPTLLVAGPQGSGRTTALCVLADSLCRRGATVVSITAPHSPVASAGPVGRSFSPEDGPGLSRFLADVEGPWVAIVDDFELVIDTPTEATLLRELRAAPRGTAAAVIAGTTSFLVSCYRGLASESRRSGAALVLHPGSGVEDQLLGRRIPACDELPPGRGVLVVGATMTTVQVARRSSGDRPPDARSASATTFRRQR